MKKIKVKNIYTIVAVNVIGWYGKEDTQDRLKKLPLTFQYAIKKNLRDVATITEEFNKFKEEKENDIRTKWFSNDDFSYSTTITQDDGQEVEGRKIKDEYITQYQEEINSFNKELEKLLSVEEEIKYTPIDIDALVEVAGDDSITMEDVDVISLFEDDDEGE